MSIEEIKTNIKRLERTIELSYWQEGYIENCKRVIKFYKQQLKNRNHVTTTNF